MSSLVRIMRRPGHNRFRSLLLAVSAALIASIVLWCPSSVGAAANIRVGTFPLNPLIFTNDQGLASGIYAELLEQIAEQNDWSIWFVPGSWNEGLERIRRGDLDLITSVMYSKDRDRFLEYSQEPVFTIWGQAYVRPDSGIENVMDLDGKTVAVMSGDMNGANFRQLAAEFQVDVDFIIVSSHHDVFTLVRDGEVNAGIAPNIFGLVNSSGYGLVGSPVIFSPTPLFFAAPEGQHKDLLEIIDTTLRRWKTDEESAYYTILEKWLSGGGHRDHGIPSWIWATAAAALAVIVLLYFWSRLLKLQVRQRTKALSKSEEKFRTLFEHVTDYALVLKPVDDELIIVDLSDSACSWHGYTRKELQGQSISLLDIEPVEVDDERLAKIHAGESLTFEVVHRRKDGTTFPVEATVRKLEIEGEMVFFSIERDISQRKAAEQRQNQLESQLRQKYKMEAVGMMAGGVAHDFNNVLFIILANLELMIKEVEPESPLRPRLDLALSATLRGSELVKQILAYTRQVEITLKPMRWAEKIEETLNMLRSTVPASIEFQTEIAPEAHDKLVQADAIQMEEVFINLCQNAVHAMGEKGLLKVSLKVRLLDDQDLPATENLSTGPYLTLAVEDRGHGMTKENLERIFDPFFTTKPAGQGTGMGLSICQGIVQKHQGFITVVSKPGQGSRFEVHLPVVEACALDEQKAPQASRTEGSERILLVDDEEHLARSVADNLRAHGYRVTVCSRSEDALDLIKSQSRRFDLIITDQTMPSLTGMELAGEIHKLNPELPIILYTGFSETASQERARAAGISAFFMKPLAMPKLMQAVREVLDTASSG